MKKVKITACALVYWSVALAQNDFPLLSSGQYTGGGGDHTTIGTPQLKLVGTVTYPRIVHLSAHANVSSVYNFETGKNVYWGEPTDAGNYIFRGRDLIVEQGKLGIGTTSPDELLHINKGNVKFEFDSQFGNDPIVQFENEGINADVRQSFYRWSGNTNLYWGTRFEREATTGFKIQMANTAVLGAHNFVDAINILNNGNVGIGTDNPGRKLTVNGDIKADHLLITDNDNTIYKQGFGFGINSDRGYLFRQHFTTELGDYIEINNQDAAGDGPRIDYIFRMSGANGFQFIPREVEAMRITNQGRVGIGVTNPDEKLVVDGKIRSEEIKVEVVNGPDYVFEPDYQLRTLQETQQYIAENKHLPEIPSAKEMENNGVDLGDMNMRLLKKIEELTLYLIEEHKHNQALTKRVENLEKELGDLKER
ncbi:MAG: hypothetical protein KI790_08840 [Cyclobacteriaceae bacterium]|nr:hypothetical protein [Cyclobacteriaceae bacterium HetDA_MAG_MS6]